MKRKLLYVAMFVSASWVAQAQTVLFSQNFNNSATIVGGGQHQFTGAGTQAGSSSNDATYVADGSKVILGKTATGQSTGIAYLVKKGMQAPNSQFLKFKFDFNMDYEGSSSNSVVQFFVGKDFSADGNLENGDVTKMYSRVTFNGFTTNNRFRVRANAGTDAINYYEGQQTITIYFNTTAEPQNYTGPDTNPYVVPGKNYHVWVGPNLQTYASTLPDIATTNNTTLPITDFKLIISGGAPSTLEIDNFEVSDLAVVLPVSLTSFTGKWENSAAQLKWQTASEQNNSHFEILRSADGANFTKIGTKNRNGTTALVSNYAYADNAALAGNNYYKLRQVDFDGKSKEYDAIVVKNPLQTQLLNTLVTTSGDLSVKLNSTFAKSSVLSVVNIQGKKIATYNATLQEGDNHLLLPFGQASAGVYILSVDGVQTQKFLKK